MNDTEYMLIFSLGPVQQFIVQARKARDLWLGSLIFAKLMEAAMANIQGNIPEKFVFPTAKTVERIPDIPNKYIAIFPSEVAAKEAAERSREQIEARWNEICQLVYLKVIGKVADETTKAIWERQTHFARLFEVYWAIAPYKDSDQDDPSAHKRSLQEVESLFAARKRLRDFLPQEEPGEKSSISGERQVLYARSGHGQDPVKEFWQRVAQYQSENDIDKEGNEHLDAIDTVKRFAMKIEKLTSLPRSEEKPFQQPFPSTSSIATASFIESVIRNGQTLSAALSNWQEATKGKLTSKAAEAAEDIPYLPELNQKTKSFPLQWLLQRDGDLYFPEMFTLRRLEKDYGITDKQKAERVISQGQKALRALLDATDVLKIARPTPYYAVLQMDGDNMGILLSGVKDQAEHKAISGGLSAFSRDLAPRIVEERYPARLVYAGGDDVLAFAPLARDAAEAGEPGHILELADELQLHYSERVRQSLNPPGDKEQVAGSVEGQAYTKRLAGITASIGIAIGHHYTSLSYVLRAAREAESTAKKRYGKNALVVTIIRRSGEQTQVGCRWRYEKLDGDKQPLEAAEPILLFSLFLDWFKRDMLSPKCVHILLEESAALAGLDREAQQSEITRVLLRQIAADSYKQLLPANARYTSLLEEAKLDEKDEKGRIKLLLKQVAASIVTLAAHMNVATESQLSWNDASTYALELHSERPRHGLVEICGWLLVMAFLARKDQE